MSSRIEIEAPYCIDYEHREPGPAGGARPSRLFLLLHGYSQSGQRIFSALDGVLPEDAAVLAPNGLYPMPEVTSEKIRVGFSWYFYNHLTDEYFIEMRPAVRVLGAMVEKLGYRDVPTTIIGFSQGGYLAPFVAEALPQTDRVIGIGARYLVDELPPKLRFRADGVHGEKDSVVDAELSRKAHEALVARGMKGSFRVIPGAEHRIDPRIAAAVQSLLSN